MTVDGRVFALALLIIVLIVCDWSLELTLPVARRTLMVMKRGLDIGAQYGKTDEFDEPGAPL